MNSIDARYRGRFAPSPTGPLHLGSLIAALASYLDAHAAGGAWLLRMEDIDPPREQAGAAAAIENSLLAHGLQWEGPVLRQSQRTAAYRAALQQLEMAGHLFACTCTRRETDTAGNCAGPCRERKAAVSQASALRVKVPAGFCSQWHDRWQGDQLWKTERLPRDFVVRRKDGLFAYQLAVVVDDHYQGITHVVRGSDLLDSTPRQHCLQALLGYTSPRYDHLPVLNNAQGQKLSKQNLAPALDDNRAANNLRQALYHLRQPPPPPTCRDVHALVDFAREHWHWQSLPRGANLPLPA